MKLYCINRLDSTGKPANEPSITLLKQACSTENIEFVELISNTYDFANPHTLDSHDLLYRVSIDSLSRQLEKFLMSMAPTTFYTDERGFWWQDNVVKASALHLAHGIPINKTVFGASDNIHILEKSVKKLGGFPIIIKVAGGSHGVGIIRADSLQSLKSLVDYLKATTKDQFILRQYLEHQTHARIIVLGSDIIDSISYSATDEDFRTNAIDEPTVSVQSFDNKINQVAIDAVRVLGLEFGGVDIIIDKRGNPHVLEVNFPCFFPRAQNISGVNIALSMVTYLKNKAHK
jgi:hypothetical protein